MTALMNAIKKEDAEAVARLIAQGADVNTLDGNRDAPLVMAAYLGNPAIVGQLLEAGADVKAVDPGMQATALHAAAYAGRAAAAALLIQHHVDINKQGPKNGYTALHDAIWQGHVETAKVIIDAGANLSLRSHHDETPLAFAKSRRQGAIAEMIETKLTGQQRG